MNKPLLSGVSILALAGVAAGGFLGMRANEKGAKAGLVMLDAGLRVHEAQRREFPKALPELLDAGPFSLGIPKDLAEGRARGYAIHYERRPAGGGTGPGGYWLTATPTVRWLTGRRTFWIDSSGQRGSE